MCQYKQDKPILKRERESESITAHKTNRIAYNYAIKTILRLGANYKAVSSKSK